MDAAAFFVWLAATIAAWTLAAYIDHTLHRAAGREPDPLTMLYACAPAAGVSAIVGCLLGYFN